MSGLLLALVSLVAVLIALHELFALAATGLGISF